MSSRSSDKSRMPDSYETDGDKHQPKHGGRKFVSDEDIVGRTDWLKQGRRELRERDQKEPKFVSDDDIVNRRVA